MISSGESCLPVDIAQRTGRDLGAGFARHGDLARLGRVTVLTVATALGDLVPAILSQELQQVSNFHPASREDVFDGPVIGAPDRIQRRPTLTATIGGPQWNPGDRTKPTSV